jgi:hypothetical protein
MTFFGPPVLRLIGMKRAKPARNSGWEITPHDKHMIIFMRAPKPLRTMRQK